MTIETLPTVKQLRKELAQYKRAVGRHIDNANDQQETLFRLEERFKETIGLLRALEAIAEAQTVGTIASVAKAIRGDYAALKKEFMKLESRCSDRSEKNYDEREKAVA